MDGDGYRDELRYFRERVDDQINWYDQISTACKRKYMAIKLAEMILSASIPLVIGYWPDICVAKLLASLFGATVVVLNGVQGLCNFHEQWIQYRFVCEELQHEKYLFQMRSGIYDGIENPFTMFVGQFESIIGNENISWVRIKKA